jgi:hypothetical protein
LPFNFLPSTLYRRREGKESRRHPGGPLLLIFLPFIFLPSLYFRQEDEWPDGGNPAAGQGPLICTDATDLHGFFCRQPRGNDASTSSISHSSMKSVKIRVSSVAEVRSVAGFAALGRSVFLAGDAWWVAGSPRRDAFWATGLSQPLACGRINYEMKSV